MNPNSKNDKSVVSVLSLAASALAVICFITGRSTLSDYLSPRPAQVSQSSVSPPTPSAPAAQTENMLTQAAFFVHYGHPAGRGTDDYDSDDREDDRQKLIRSLETYLVAAQNQSQEQGRVARTRTLLHQLNEMRLTSAPTESN